MYSIIENLLRKLQDYLEIYITKHQA